MDRMLEPLNDNVATLFLTAGGLLVMFGLLHGVEAATGGAAAADVFGPPGYALAALGLLGLYPELEDSNRWLTGSGAVVAALASVGWAVLSVLSILELGGGPLPEETVFGAVALGATGLGMILGYPLFAVATLRSDDHPRSLGLLLLAPPVIFVAVFAVLAPLVGGDGGWGPAIAASAQAVVHLAIGFALRGEVGVQAAPASRDDHVTA